MKAVALVVIEGLIWVALFSLDGAPHWAAFMGAMLMVNKAKATAA